MNRQYKGVAYGAYVRQREGGGGGRTTPRCRKPRRRVPEDTTIIFAAFRLPSVVTVITVDMSAAIAEAPMKKPIAMRPCVPYHCHLGESMHGNPLITNKLLLFAILCVFPLSR